MRSSLKKILSIVLMLTLIASIIVPAAADVPVATDVAFISATAPANVITGQNFAVIATTSPAVTDVGIFTGVDRVTATNAISDVDGVRTWVITINIAEPGDYQYVVRFLNASGGWQDGSALAVTAAADTTPPTVARPMPTRQAVHDPSIRRDPNAEVPTWYVFGSNRGVARSTDLMNWKQ